MMEGVTALALFWSHVALLGGVCGFAFVLGLGRV